MVGTGGTALAAAINLSYLDSDIVVLRCAREWPHGADAEVRSRTLKRRYLGRLDLDQAAERQRKTPYVTTVRMTGINRNIRQWETYHEIRRRSQEGSRHGRLL